MENGRNKRLQFGLGLIVVGLIIILNRFNLIPFKVTDILFSWQMILIIIGTVLLINRNMVAGNILMAIGIFSLIPEIFNVPYEYRRIYWPALMVIIGLILVFSSRKNTKHHLNHLKKSGLDIDSFDDFVIFGGRESCINSQNFKFGKAVSIFGGIDYDFRQAQLDTEIVVIDCLCIFGGISFKVPPDWTVKNEVTTILGAFTDHRSDSFLKVNTDPTKLIVVTGTVIAGGINIKFV